MSFEWSEADRVAGWSLPAPYFYDAGIFQQERERIFLRTWHLVAHVNELRNPGDFVTYGILDQSIIVTRSKEGIRAFHNACQHRGNRLLEVPRGNTPAITCGYHGWSYSMDGKLRGAPRTEWLADFDKSRHGLKAVKLEIFACFVYINLDPDASSVAGMAPGAEAQMRRFLPDLDRLSLIEQVDVPVAAKWKVIQENSIEGYHFDYSGPVHKQLVQLIDFEGYRLESRDKSWTYIGPPRPGVTEAYGVPLTGANWQTDWFFNIGLWPNVTIYAFPYADVVGTFIMNPTGPETSNLRFGYYRIEGRELPEVTKACIRWMNEQLGPEDIRLNVSNQKGLKSLGFTRGRYLIGDQLNNRSDIWFNIFIIFVTMPSGLSAPRYDYIILGAGFAGCVLGRASHAVARGTCAAAGGGSGRSQLGNRDALRCGAADFLRVLQLELGLGAGALSGRSAAHASARPRPGWIFFHPRHGVCPRSRLRLRQLGPWGRRPDFSHAQPSQHARPACLGSQSRQAMAAF